MGAEAGRPSVCSFARTVGRLRALCLGLIVASLFEPGCDGFVFILTSSPAITPVAATIGVGTAQVFIVQNVMVTRFVLTADVQNGTQCVAVDAAYAQANSIRLVARAPCRSSVYVSALSTGQSPLVATLTVQ
jgi:hypothetical protein